MLSNRKRMSDICVENLFKDHLERSECGLYLYYVKDQYMLIDCIGQCISKRYKKIPSLILWFKNNVGGI